jgi:hypothetical protein
MTSCGQRILQSSDPLFSHGNGAEFGLPSTPFGAWIIRASRLLIRPVKIWTEALLLCASVKPCRNCLAVGRSSGVGSALKARVSARSIYL